MPMDYNLLSYEPPVEVAQPRTWWEVLWDAIRGIFVAVVYAIIDGIVQIVKRLIWDAAYGWREE